MFFRKKRETRTYDRETQEPMIHASICTGEQVAGFRDLSTGRFTEIMLIRTPGDLKEFCLFNDTADAEIYTQY